jgi:hypothetical protein
VLDAPVVRATYIVTDVVLRLIYRQIAGARANCQGALGPLLRHLLLKEVGIRPEISGTLRLLRATRRRSWRTVAARGACLMGMDSETRELLIPWRELSPEAKARLLKERHVALADDARGDSNSDK